MKEERDGSPTRLPDKICTGVLAGESGKKWVKREKPMTSWPKVGREIKGKGKQRRSLPVG